MPYITWQVNVVAVWLFADFVDVLLNGDPPEPHPGSNNLGTDRPTRNENREKKEKKKKIHKTIGESRVTGRKLKRDHRVRFP